jgi:pre-mRNA-processing factor 39
LDYQAHPFWDKYVEFEERVEQPAKVFAILERIVRVPMQKYREYFEKFRTLASYRPLDELESVVPLAQWQEELQASHPHAGPHEVERELRTRVDSHFLTVYNATHSEVVKRTVHEDGIKRPYFHVTEIDDAELNVWRKYLDFEESEGSYERTKFLYERCVVICALYEEFWLRYVRWLEAQHDKTEEVRIVYQRASTVFVPIVKPTIRLHYALFEEVQERVQVARDMHIAILEQLPSHLESIVSLANLERRHGGIDAAIEVYKSYITSQQTDLFAKGALVSEWANMLWKVKGSPDEARDIFRSQAEYYTGSRPFWVSYFFFELAQPEIGGKQYQRVKKVFEDVARRSQILPAAVRDLAEHYKAYLLERGTGEAAKEYLKVDREING